MYYILLIICVIGLDSFIQTAYEIYNDLYAIAYYLNFNSIIYSIFAFIVDYPENVVIKYIIPHITNVLSIINYYINIWYFIYNYIQFSIWTSFYFFKKLLFWYYPILIINFIDCTIREINEYFNLVLDYIEYVLQPFSTIIFLILQVFPIKVYNMLYSTLYFLYLDIYYNIYYSIHNVFYSTLYFLYSTLYFLYYTLYFLYLDIYYNIYYSIYNVFYPTLYFLYLDIYYSIFATIYTTLNFLYFDIYCSIYTVVSSTLYFLYLDIYYNIYLYYNNKYIGIYNIIYDNILDIKYSIYYTSIYIIGSVDAIMEEIYYSLVFMLYDMLHMLDDLLYMLDDLYEMYINLYFLYTQPYISIWYNMLYLLDEIYVNLYFFYIQFYISIQYSMLYILDKIYVNLYILYFYGFYTCIFFTICVFFILSILVYLPSTRVIVQNNIFLSWVNKLDKYKDLTIFLNLMRKLGKNKTLINILFNFIILFFGIFLYFFFFLSCLHFISIVVIFIILLNFLIYFSIFFNISLFGFKDIFEELINQRIKVKKQPINYKKFITHFYKIFFFKKFQRNKIKLKFLYKLLIFFKKHNLLNINISDVKDSLFLIHFLIHFFCIFFKKNFNYFILFTIFFKKTKKLKSIYEVDANSKYIEYNYNSITGVNMYSKDTRKKIKIWWRKNFKRHGPWVRFNNYTESFSNHLFRKFFPTFAMYHKYKTAKFLKVLSEKKFTIHHKGKLFKIGLVTIYKKKINKLRNSINVNNYTMYFITNTFQIVNRLFVKNFFKKNKDLVHKPNYSSTSINKYLNLKNIKNFNFQFLRKNKVYNKGRYSRTRQNYRTGVYMCMYLSVVSILGLYYTFFGFIFNFSYLWWFFISFLASFLIPKIIKYRLYEPNTLFYKFCDFFYYLVNLINSFRK